MRVAVLWYPLIFSEFANLVACENRTKKDI